MKELLSLEFRKLSKQKSLYICLAIMLGLILLSAVAYKIILVSAVDMGDFADIMLDLNATKFTLMTISNANFLIIMGIVIAISYCYDFEEQTVKNIFARGYSRKSFYFAKMCSVLCSTAFLFIISFAFSFIMGAIFFGVGSDNILSMLGLIGLQLLACIAYSMAFLLVCTLFKKKASAIAINIVFPLILTVVLTLIDSIINAENFKIANYWLDGMITATSTLSADTTVVLITLIGSIVYCGIFTLLGMFVSKKIEV